MSEIFQIIILLLVTPVLGYSQINFEDISLAEALKKAEQEGKKVFLDVYTSWCGPCKLMSKEVFSDKKIGEYMAQEYIAIKIDAEKSPHKKELRAYYIKGYPTMLLLDSKGLELGRIYGGRRLAAFKKELDTYHAIQQHPIFTAFEQLEKYPKNQTVWKKSLEELSNYTILLYKNKLSSQYKAACEQYYEKFHITQLDDKVDLAIFLQVKPPLEHPVAQFYLQDSIDYASYTHMDYMVESFRKKAKNTKSKTETTALKEAFEAYYEYCYKIWYGDVADKEYYMEAIFERAPSAIIEEKE